MARFIEVTHMSGDKFLVNVEHIAEVAPTMDNNCIILLSIVDSGIEYIVFESYDIVKEMLEEIS